MSSFETAVAKGEEYFEYEGVELKRELRCSGCDETLELGADHTAHTAKCEANGFVPDPDEPVYEVSADALYEAYLESKQEDDGCGYDRYRDQHGIDY